MYLLLCFILLPCLEGLNSTNTTITSTIFTTAETSTILIATSKSDPDTTIHSSTSNIDCSSKQKSEPCNCLFDIQDKKELKLWGMISALVLICLLLLVVIMCLACKCCRSNKSDELVIVKSTTSIRKNSLNDGHSETDIMLQDFTSVKLEIQTIPEESQVPKEVGEAAAAVEVGSQVSTENENPVNNANETVATPEHLKTDVKMEDLEKAE